MQKFEATPSTRTSPLSRVINEVRATIAGPRGRVQALVLAVLPLLGCVDDRPRHFTPTPTGYHPRYPGYPDEPEQEVPDESLTPKNIDERFERRVSEDLKKALDSSEHMNSFFINSIEKEEWKSIIQDLPFGFRGSNVNISIKIYEDERRGAKDHYLDFDSNGRLKIVWINDPTHLAEQREKVFQIIKRAILNPEFQEAADDLDYDLYSFFSDDEKVALSQFSIVDNKSLNQATRNFTLGGDLSKSQFTASGLHEDIKVTGTFSKDLFDGLPKGKKGMLMRILMHSGFISNVIDLYGFDYVKNWHMFNGLSEEEFYLSMAKANPTYIFSHFDLYRDKVWAEEVLQAAMYGVSFATVKAQLEEMDLPNEFKEKLRTENEKREEGGIILERYKMGDINGSFLRNELIHASPQVQFSILYQEAISNSFFIFSVTNMDIYRIKSEQREQILVTALSHAARSRKHDKYFERKIVTPIRRKYGQEIIDKTYRQLEKDQEIANALLWRQLEEDRDIEALMKDPGLVGISSIDLSVLGNQTLDQLGVLDSVNRESPSEEDRFLITDLKAMISRSLYLMKRPINPDNIEMAAKTIIEAREFYKDQNMLVGSEAMLVAQPERREPNDCGDDCTDEQRNWNEGFKKGGIFNIDPYRFGRDDVLSKMETLNPSARRFRAKNKNNKSAKRILNEVKKVIGSSTQQLFLVTDSHIGDAPAYYGFNTKKRISLSSDSSMALSGDELNIAYGEHQKRRKYKIEGSGVIDPDYLMINGCFGHSLVRGLVGLADRPMAVLIVESEYGQVSHSESNLQSGDMIFEKLFNAGEASGTLGTLITGDTNSGTANATIYVPWQVKNPVTGKSDVWTVVQVR